MSKGRIVGQGGFSIVSEINQVTLDEVNDTNAHQLITRLEKVPKIVTGKERKKKEER